MTGVSLFLTGKAGTGKTTFLRDIDAHCRKRHVVVAPTGVAAVNAGGVTIHSFFQLPFDPYLPDVKELVTEYQMPEAHKGLSKSKQDIIRTLELLIIDEISMVRADLLDAIDMTLRRYRRSSRPFGGVQLLMIGDVHQLPPVVTDSEKPFMERVYPSPFFFHSKALRQLPYVTIELSQVYRQQDSAFVTLLNHVRDNDIDSETLSKLNARVGRGASGGSITLTTHNRQADAINRRHMEALTGESRWFDAEVRGIFPDSMMPVERRMELIVGERVMLVKNDSSGAHRYYNGKLATVTGFGETPRPEGSSPYVEVIDDDGGVIELGREVWENTSYAIDPKDNGIVQHVDGTFCQYPLRPAWAVTIHKAQGLTFDRVSVNAADAFAFGQVYVALSRCRTLEGLSLSAPLTAGVAFGDDDVNRFCAAQPTFESVCQSVAQYERQYRYEQLADLFSMTATLADAERLTAVYGKLKGIYGAEAADVEALRIALVELDSVSERFIRQLMGLPEEQHAARVARATEYYVAQLAPLAMRLGKLLVVEVDNKETRKQLKEAGDALAERVGQKLACLEVVRKDGFSVEAVQQAKADYLLEERKSGHVRKRKAEKRKAESESTPALVDLLRRWRKEKAEKQGVAPYIVLQQKALLAIAANMPTSVAELKRQQGVGEVTVERYGKELLDIVADFREHYGLK